MSSGRGSTWSSAGRRVTLKYEFLVSPGADPCRDIGLAYRGAEALSIGAGGALLIGTPWGTLRDEKPRTFQVVDGRRVPVESQFALGDKAGTYGFALGAYDTSRPLVIDPGLLYATYLGGAEFEEANHVASAPDGSMYVDRCYASRRTFPSTAGAFDRTRGGSSDGFVMKFGAGGSLVYATFIGGSSPDRATSVDVDSSWERLRRWMDGLDRLPDDAGSARDLVGCHPGRLRREARRRRLGISSTRRTSADEVHHCGIRPRGGCRRKRLRYRQYRLVSRRRPERSTRR